MGLDIHWHFIVIVGPIEGKLGGKLPFEHRTVTKNDVFDIFLFPSLRGHH